MTIHYGFDSLIAEVKANGGGTYYLSAQGGRVFLGTSGIRTGYYVAREGNEIILSPDAFDKFAISDYLNAHAKALIEEPDVFIGFWIANSGRVYLDLSEHFEDFENALSYGMQRDQEAIWDIANGKEITIRSALGF